MTTKDPISTTGELETRDGVRLHFAADEVESPRAALMLLHGFGEHCHRYDAVVARMCAGGYSVYRIDLRGHGRSRGARGHVYAFEDYLQDAQALRDETARRQGESTRILLGHSNGGLVALHSLARSPEGVSGLVLSSPFFGFRIQVPAAKVLAGRVFSRIMPALGLPTGLDPTTVSHDPRIVEDYATDPLNVRVASGRWFTETVRAQTDALARARDLQLPVLLQQAGDDRIASSDAARNVYERLGGSDLTWREYPGLFHEIWFELENEAPLRDLEQWLGDRTSTSVA